MIISLIHTNHKIYSVAINLSYLIAFKECYLYTGGDYKEYKHYFYPSVFLLVEIHK